MLAGLGEVCNGWRGEILCGCPALLPVVHTQHLAFLPASLLFLSHRNPHRAVGTSSSLRDLILTQELKFL